MQKKENIMRPDTSYQNRVGLKAENASMKSRISEDYQLKNIIGNSRPMKELIDMMDMSTSKSKDFLLWPWIYCSNTRGSQPSAGLESTAKALHKKLKEYGMD